MYIKFKKKVTKKRAIGSFLLLLFKHHYKERLKIQTSGYRIGGFNLFFDFDQKA